MLWVMAVATVIGGALWAGNDWARETAGARTGSDSEVPSPDCACMQVLYHVLCASQGSAITACLLL